MTNDTYLGDGLYASFDGFQFRLWTQRGDGTHEVFLESSVLEAFEAFVSVVREGPAPNDHDSPSPPPESPAEEVGETRMGPPR